MIQSTARFFPAVLVIFHIIGIILFVRSNEASDLTWMNLSLCGLLVYLTEIERMKAFTIFAVIFTGGFLIELIGTQTGFLFGNYSYGEVLGWRLFGVSLIIGINWYAIVLASSNLARLVNVSVFLQALIAGVLCVAMDYVIEPVAIKYGFWTWEEGVIPFYNYLTWFVFAVVFSLLYLKNSLLLNKTAIWLYFVWLIFFILLSFM